MDGGVDADDATARSDEGAAGVAGVEGGVGLDDVLDDALAVGGGEGAAEGADDAGGDGGLEAVGVADGDGHLADAQAVRIAEGGGGELLGVVALDAEDGEVGGGIGADDFDLEAAAVGRDGFELAGVLDDVVVGEDVAVRGQEEAGAGAADFEGTAAGAHLAEDGDVDDGGADAGDDGADG